MLILQDRRPRVEELADGPCLSNVLQMFRIRPRVVPDISWAWEAKFVLTMGSTLTTTYGFYFLTDQLGVASADLSRLITLTGLVVWQRL
ncbi:hypothetical protein [Mycobacterium sp. SMC-19]|uniref:hypothetical protein n=1 Tax=Mycobacterium sp. SMC-19 TaxID=3381630 RepID=UPI003875B4B8